MKKLFLIVVALILGFSIYIFWPEKEIVHLPGILIADQPLQKNLNGIKTWQSNDFSFKALAEFNIQARVLSTKSYNSGTESKISPVDFVLGWGPMSDQGVIDRITISQSNRWYYWKTDSYPIPLNQISVNSANMHIIPANEGIEKKLNHVYRGSLIEIRGFLVEVNDGNGWRWKSSLSREDTGGGACELIWVDELKIL